MPLVVSDTSPLGLLVQIGHAHVLEAMFGHVVIPPAVERELTHPNAPEVVRSFCRALPAWASVRAPTTLLPLDLDPGETAAISLVVELAAPVLIDEQAGRAVAQGRGLTVVGAVGVLERAGGLGLIADLAAVHGAIRRLPFHVSDGVLDASLTRHEEHVARRGRNCP